MRKDDTICCGCGPLPWSNPHQFVPLLSLGETGMGRWWFPTWSTCSNCVFRCVQYVSVFIEWFQFWFSSDSMMISNHGPMMVKFWFHCGPDYDSMIVPIVIPWFPPTPCNWSQNNMMFRIVFPSNDDSNCDCIIVPMMVPLTVQMMGERFPHQFPWSHDHFTMVRSAKPHLPVPSATIEAPPGLAFQSSTCRAFQREPSRSSAEKCWKAKGVETDTPAISHPILKLNSCTLASCIWKVVSSKTDSVGSNKKTEDPPKNTNRFTMETNAC